MRFLILLLCLILPAAAYAQNENLDVTDEPICFSIRNEASYKVYGVIRTAHFVREDGIKTRHSANFRLDPPGSTEPKTGNLTDRTEFCSYGPFLPGRKLSFELRTLVPIFSCQTKIDQGEIVVKGFYKEEGGTETWAECYL